MPDAASPDRQSGRHPRRRVRRDHEAARGGSLVAPSGGQARGVGSQVRRGCEGRRSDAGKEEVTVESWARHGRRGCLGARGASGRVYWRRGRDSNPGQRFCPCNRLAGGCLRPTRPPLQTSSPQSIRHSRPSDYPEGGSFAILGGMNPQTAADRPMTNMRELLRDAWAIARPYWFSEDKWAGRGLLVAVIALNLGIVVINVMLNKWNNAFYNSLQDKNYEIFLQQLFRFTWLAGSFIVVAVYELYLNQMLQIRWRRWLTERYLNA